MPERKPSYWHDKIDRGEYQDFSGNAQQRKRSHLLHHGSLLYDFDLKLIGRYLTPEDVAGRVLRAVKANRLYVIPHEEAREPLRRRFERMDKAFEESR